MNIFDIVGPVMVGPSSSHTAGAVRIGRVSRLLLGEKPVKAVIGLHGSFRATGRGHGTDRALVAGLLGMKVDDPRIPDSFQIAGEEGLDFVFRDIDLQDAHPNTAKLNLTGVSGRRLETVCSSVGGGRIQVDEIDGLKAGFSGEQPTLVVNNVDRPGYVTEVTRILAAGGINVAKMKLNRDRRGGAAVMVLECDTEIPESVLRKIRDLPGITKITSLSLEEQHV
ncbi:MAG: L-serine ammonia-lyase, iron-sulfur-dependent subunit beta [Lachnospiraceae bacterium]|jgi:L-serine dehydratase